MKKIGVLGAGTWGVALARMLSNSGHQVTVWSALEEEIDTISATRQHPNLPGVHIPEAICLTKEIADACQGQDVVLFAVPSVFVRGTASKAAPFLQKGQIVVDVAKGIETGTLRTMTQIIGEEIANPEIPLVALSGPTHAEEVAKDLPTTIVSACEEETVAQQVQEIFSNTCMRVYTNTDVLGVELCGAAKNVIALASGIALGLGYGDNTKAALLTRGLNEITHLGIAMGCCPETFYGLAGMGDLIVTATSVHSRNNRCGQLIGQGLQPAEAIRKVGMVVEGINALPAILQLARTYQIEMPIVEAIDRVIRGETKPADAVEKLMSRDQKPEHN